MHARHRSPTHVPAYNIARTGSRGGTKGTLLDNRPPYAALTLDAREHETRRLEQRIRRREETIQLLREWGPGTPAETQAEVQENQRANAADLLMIEKMTESAKGDEQAVWTIAMSKVRSMAREHRQSQHGASQQSRTTVSSWVSNGSVDAATVADGGPPPRSVRSEFSLARLQKEHEQARRAKARKQKKAELEIKRLAADMNLSITRGRTPSAQRTVHLSEAEDKELQRQVKLREAERLQKQRDSLVASNAEDSDEDSQPERLRLPSVGPERVLPQVMDGWSARLPRACRARCPPEYLELGSDWRAV